MILIGRAVTVGGQGTSPIGFSGLSAAPRRDDQDRQASGEISAVGQRHSFMKEL
jgi:hypothetical protein